MSGSLFPFKNLLFPELRRTIADDASGLVWTLSVDFGENALVAQRGNEVPILLLYYSELEDGWGAKIREVVESRFDYIRERICRENSTFVINTKAMAE